jgi:hypothetical protein
MSILLASDQYTVTNSAVSTANSASDAIMLEKYGDVFSQIEYKSTQGLYTTTYTITDLTDATAFSSMLVRAGYAVTQNVGTFNISWLFVSGVTTASVLPTDSVGVLTNNGTGTLSWVPDTSITLTSNQVTTALGFTPIPASGLSVTTASATGTGALSYSNGVFTFTPARLTASQINSALGYVPKTFAIAMSAAMS